MWGLLAALLWGAVMGGLGTLGAVLAYAKRHPGLLIRAAFEYGLDQPESADADGPKAAPQP
jgi:hypothetical protein